MQRETTTKTVMTLCTAVLYSPKFATLLHCNDIRSCGIAAPYQTKHNAAERMEPCDSGKNDTRQRHKPGNGAVRELWVHSTLCCATAYASKVFINHPNMWHAICIAATLGPRNV